MVAKPCVWKYFQDMKIDISIVIVNWNTRNLLLDCLSSVSNTTVGSTVETIVVDNGSHDGSAQAVSERFPKVTLI